MGAIKKEYVAMGPDLYMRVFYPENVKSDTYIAHYDSDEQAQKAAVRWNRRKNSYEKSIQTNKARTNN